jgi:hypothetical protein
LHEILHLLALDGHNRYNHGMHMTTTYDISKLEDALLLLLSRYALKEKELRLLKHDILGLRFKLAQAKAKLERVQP